MKKSSRSMKQKQWKERPEITVGVDMGDRFSHYCVVNGEGEVMEEGRLRTTGEAFQRQFEGAVRQRIALEAGPHSPWANRLLEELGHQVIVANPRQIPALTASESKNDRNDAEKLARFAHCDPLLLSPLRHRSLERQTDLNRIRVRDLLVRSRTMLINAARGMVKSAGGRLPSCSSEAFVSRVQPYVPAELREILQPLLEQITSLKEKIRVLDQEIAGLEQRYPEIRILRTVPGVGPIVASTYVLTLDGPDTMASSRQAGAFLGLRPRQSQSGDANPQQRISKTGNVYLRRLLVQSAQYLLGRFAPDCALRRWGLKLAGAGGKRGKKRAIVAVARKLAVLLHRLWKSGESFQPITQSAPGAVA